MFDNFYFTFLVGFFIGMPVGFILYFLRLHYQIYKSNIAAELQLIKQYVELIHKKVSALDPDKNKKE